MHQVDVARGIAEDERHEPQASRKGLIDSTVLIGGETKLPANGRSVRPTVARTTSPASSDHGSPRLPRPPAFETAAGRRGSAAPGAWTTGSSIPSNSHTGVWLRTRFAPFLAPRGAG